MLYMYGVILTADTVKLCYIIDIKPFTSKYTLGWWLRAKIFISLFEIIIS